MIASPDRSRTFGRRREPHRITIEHGDSVRAFHIDTGRLVLGAAAVAVFGFAYLAATAYLLFRDDILTGSISRQVRMERAYEDRVASLRAEIDRINGRQLIDQEAFEAKIETLLARQAKLGEVQNRITQLVGKAGDAGLQPLAGPKGAGLTPAAVPSRPEAGETTGTIAPAAPPPLDAERFAAPLRSSWFAPLTSPAKAANGRDAGARIAGAERAIDGSERQQTQAAGALAEAAESRTRTYGKVLGRLGFRVPDTAAPAAKPIGEAKSGGGVGGPFVPTPASEAILKAEAALGRLAGLRKAAAQLPLGRPMAGRPAVTSDFGARVDPFMGMPAIHTGIDFRAETGEPVRVTGPGTVTTAGRQGGYGLVVDVDHGNGVVTRYGHLSAIGVTAGTKVAAGETVGWAGSTGRSTGPHLHYETRVAGEAVDPRDWLDAGRELGF